MKSSLAIHRRFIIPVFAYSPFLSRGCYNLFVFFGSLDLLFSFPLLPRLFFRYVGLALRRYSGFRGIIAERAGRAASTKENLQIHANEIRETYYSPSNQFTSMMFPARYIYDGIIKSGRALFGLLTGRLNNSLVSFSLLPSPISLSLSLAHPFSLFPPFFLSFFLAHGV